MFSCLLSLYVCDFSISIAGFLLLALLTLNLGPQYFSFYTQIIHNLLSSAQSLLWVPDLCFQVSSELQWFKCASNYCHRKVYYQLFFQGFLFQSVKNSCFVQTSNRRPKTLLWGFFLPLSSIPNLFPITKTSLQIQLLSPSF